MDDNNPSFDLNEKMEYKYFTKKIIPEDIIFPEELNRFLRDQIRELTTENGCLRRSLTECEEKLLKIDKNESKNIGHKSNMNETENATTTAIGIVKSSEITASKIIGELSKKCRDQTSEIERLKSKYKKVQLKSENGEKLENEKRISRSCINDSSGDGIDSRQIKIEESLKLKEEEIKILNDKILQINSKLYESKNTCTSLRQELNKTQKLLYKEIGENITSIGNLSSHQSGWKGRAEQIRQLKNKLIEYENGSSKGSSSSAVTLVEKRNITNLRKLEKDRREQSENRIKELDQLNLDIELYKKKYEASKARVKILENNLSGIKNNVSLLNEKRIHDEQLVEALNDQLKAVEEKFHNRDKELIRIKETFENDYEKILTERKRLESINRNLLSTIEERETEIANLKNGNIGYNLKEDKNDDKINNTTSSMRDLQSKIESNSTNVDYNEYLTLGIAAEAERERLLELVIVLNRRLDEERFSNDEISETLRIERNKLAKLETKLQRLEMEKFGINDKINNVYNKFKIDKKSTKIFSRHADDIDDEKRFRLELLEEECLALKTRLSMLKKDKSYDLIIYKQMLDQARKIFQDACRGKKPESSNQSGITI